MNKKIYLLLFSLSIVFVIKNGYVLAADAVTAYIEPSSASYILYTSSSIKARVVFFDATGVLATAFGGAQIGDSILELKSMNYENAAIFTANGSTSQPVNINNDGYQEFEIAYDPARIAEPGDDIIRVTLKKDTKSISSTIPVAVLAPAANSYAVRTGLSSSLVPDVLAPILPRQNNTNALISAGTAVNVTVLAAFGRDTDADDIYDTYIFTDTVPEGAERVNISASNNTVTIAHTNATLENGIATVSVTPQDLKIPDILEKAADTGAQAMLMNQLLDPAQGVVATWKAVGSITREVGNEAGDATIDKVVIDQAKATFGCAFDDTAISSDTSAHKPAPVKLVTIIGIPLNDPDGAPNGSVYGSGLYSASDAYNLLIDPTAKPTTFLVNGPATGTSIVGAIVGFDQFNNPAPFTTSGVALPQFVLQNTVVSPVPGWSQGSATGLTPSAGQFFSAFMPFVVASAPGANTNVYIDPDLSSASPKATFANVDTTAEGVTFQAADKVKSVTAGSLNGITAGNDDVSIQAVAEAGLGDSFNLRVKTASGKTVQVNTKDSTTAQDSLTIPRDGSTLNAKQDVVFFTRAYDEDVFLIIEGKTNPRTITNMRVPKTGVNILPADPGDYPPKEIKSSLSAIRAVVDTDHDEIVLTGAVSIYDAFRNSYSGNATLEDADPKVAVLKADGVTPYPGATATVRGNDIILRLTLSSITAENGAPVLKVTAGSASSQITYMVRALVATSLKSTFCPIFGIDDMPIVLSFADQYGAFIRPNFTDPVAGYEVDVEAIGGTTSEGNEFTKVLDYTNSSFEFIARFNENHTGIFMTISADGKSADAGLATWIPPYNDPYCWDKETPVIGAVTVNGCCISIAITDNVAVDLACTTVKITPSASNPGIPEPIAQQLCEGDGTPTASCKICFSEPGEYGLEIIACDTSGNKTKASRTVTIINCPEPKCVSVEPAFVYLGASVNIVIKGENTHFDTTSQVLFSCTGVTVNSSTAKSANEIVANITTGCDSPIGMCDVTVTTGTEVVTCESGAAVTCLPMCEGVSPSTATAGTTLDVSFKLHCSTLITEEQLSVGFNCTGITVNSVTAINDRPVVANITISEDAPGKTCDVTVIGVTSCDAGSGLICRNAFTVIPKPLCAITVAPTLVRTRIFFPRTTNLTITGNEGCAFDSSTTVTIDGGVKVLNTEFMSATELKVTVQIPPVILGGKGYKKVTVQTGDTETTTTLTVGGLIF